MVLLPAQAAAPALCAASGAALQRWWSLHVHVFPIHIAFLFVVLREVL